MADYHSIIDKAVSALDLNTEQARRQIYERARATLHLEMHKSTLRFVAPKLRLKKCL